MHVDTLNERFAVPGQLTFSNGPGGLPFAEISNHSASARVCLLGAHVTDFQPHGQQPVLWMSRCSEFEVGKPVRGGIPVCWPWFGPHPAAADKPNHGFVRRILWDVDAVTSPDEATTVIRFVTQTTPASRSDWPHDFRLEMTVRVGSALGVDLDAHNTGNTTVTCTGALHTYFAVSDIRAVSVSGLEGCTYIDTVGPRRRLIQDGPVRFAAETDSIFVDTASDNVIADPGLNRQIRIAKSGSRSAVVWNPWIAKSRRMEDFGDDEYLRMVCVETTNVDDDAVCLPPGGRHRLGAVIKVEPL